MSISYIVPTLNSAATLDLTLYSLHSQKVADLEVIVVDSGSVDRTLEICQRWNVKTLYAEPGNMYRAINIGMKIAKGEWLGYINSDDWFYPNTLSRSLELAKTTKADIVYGACDYTDGSSRFVYSFAPAKPEQLLSLFRTQIFGFAQPTAVFKRSVYDKLEGFAESYYYSADADFYLRALKANFKFELLPGLPITCFRIHPNQLTNQKAELMEQEKAKIYAQVEKAGLQDLLVFVQWRIKNLPHYLIRLLRQSLLSGEITITKSMEAHFHENI